MSENRLGFDIRSPEFLDDPHPYYRELRERNPILYDEDWQAWFVTSYDACRAIVRDERIGHHTAPNNPFITENPPQHTRLRKLTSQALSKDFIARHRGGVQERMDRIMDAVPTGQRIDLMETIAAPFPVSVISDLFGYPDEDFDKLMRYARVQELTFDPIHDQANDPELHAAKGEFALYLQDLCMKRMQNPGDDLLTRLMMAEIDGDRFTPEELISTTILLLVAGFVTTANLIGNGTKLLLSNPEQKELLRSEPELIPNAVEELLRMEPPGAVGYRYALEEMSYGDTTFKKGDLIFLVVAAANRDPKVYENPDVFDPRRKPNPHMSFGGGIHACLGAPLGHMEGVIAFTEILTKLPQMELVEGGYDYYESFAFRALKRLEVDV